MKILLLNGINLNMLGKRDPEQYGTITLTELESELIQLAEDYEWELECFQTNYEGEMVERIHQAYFENVEGVIINPGAWTHYSYAIRDALDILECPIVEVHLSDINHREDFRKNSVIRSVVRETIMGKGLNSYREALKWLIEK